MTTGPPSSLTLTINVPLYNGSINGYSTVPHWMNRIGRYSRPAARYSARVPLLCPTDLWQTFRWRGAEHNAGVEAARMDLIALEGRVATARVEVRGGGGAAAELELAGCLYELACGYLATGQDGSVRNRQAAAMEPAQEAATIRLKWLTSGYVSAEFAGKLQDTLRVVEQAARAAGHRDLAIEPLRNACAAYAQVARNHPEAAGVCADGLSKCGVWLCRSEPYEAVKAADEATKIRAALFIADPGQSRKYLATLNMLLRTLMVGRSRKQAVAMYRQRYAALTSANMTAQLRTMKIEEVGFTNKTYTALAKLDCATLERAGRLTQQHILYQSGGDLATIEEINWHLALVGLKPLAPGAIPDPPAKPVEIGSSFGALTVHCTTAGAVRRVREAVIAAYAADGAELVSVSQFTGIPKERWTNPEM
ncbi:MAG: hypothetical protein J2P17_34565, partial [Mycobacterium sp.]|nr:hypothetical protein [Mycobacterium sp.]